MWLFLGQPGVGKTTAANLWIAEVLRATPGAVALIHDPHGSDAGGDGYAGRPWPSVAAFRAAPEIARRNCFRLEEPQVLARLALELGQRVPVVLAIDELDMAVTPGGRFVDDGKVDRGALYRIANYGRHVNVALVGTARRASRLGTDLPSNAEGLFLLRLSGHTDLAWVREITDEETASAVGALPRYRGILWDKFGGRSPFTVEPRRLALR